MYLKFDWFWYELIDIFGVCLVFLFGCEFKFWKIEFIFIVNFFILLLICFWIFFLNIFWLILFKNNVNIIEVVVNKICLKNNVKIEVFKVLYFVIFSYLSWFLELFNVFDNVFLFFINIVKYLWYIFSLIIDIIFFILR